jgi:hypothetical protein
MWGPGFAELQQSAGNRAVHRSIESRGRRDALPGPVASVLSRQGQRLEPSVRAFMESRFGHDFEEVRIHADGESAKSARSVGAAAYTVGTHVVFGEGRYAPDTTVGARSLGHELAHVVQQARGGSPHLPAAADSAIEQAADRAGAAVVSGAATVPVAGATAPGLARQEDDEAKKFQLPDDYEVPPLSPFFSKPDTPYGARLFDPGQLGAEFASRGLLMRLGDEEAGRQHFERWYPLAQGMYKLPFMSKIFDNPADLMNALTVKAAGTQLSFDNPTALEASDFQLQRSGLPTPTYLPPLKFKF